MPRKSKSLPSLTVPGDMYEMSFDGHGLSLYPAQDGGGEPNLPSLDPRLLSSVCDFVERGLYLPITFVEDNGCTARFRLGDTDPQEDAEWIGQVVWKLDLRGGRLGCNEQVIVVPPAEYRVEVRLYLPNTSAHEILGQVDKQKEQLWDYWLRTHEGTPLPGWLVERVTSQDEDVIDPGLLPADEDRSDIGAGFRVKVNGQWRALPRPSPVEYTDVVVRLTPLAGKLTTPELSPHNRFNKPAPKGKSREWKASAWSFLWDCRKPAVCPAGLERGHT